MQRSCLYDVAKKLSRPIVVVKKEDGRGKSSAPGIQSEVSRAALFVSAAAQGLLGCIVIVGSIANAVKVNLADTTRVHTLHALAPFHKRYLDVII